MKLIDGERSIQTMNRVRRLPFALAHIDAIVARGAAPINALHGLAEGERAELPKRLADSGTPSPVHSVHDACGELLGRGDEAWQAPGEVERAFLVPGAARRFRSCEKTRGDHSS